MSSDRLSRRAAICGLIALGGCGFVPVYGEGSALRGTVVFETENSVAGFRLRERLEERLGASTAPRYNLRVILTDRSRTSAITADGDTTRFNVIGTARWTLTDLESDRVVERGAVETFTSYSATGSTVATQAAADDATTRLAVALADMIVSRLLVLLPELST